MPEIRADTQITTRYGGNERISVISLLEIIRGEMTIIIIGFPRSKKYNIEIQTLLLSNLHTSLSLMPLLSEFIQGFDRIQRTLISLLCLSHNRNV